MTEAQCQRCTIEDFGLRGRGTQLAVLSIVIPIVAFILVLNRIFWRLNMLGRLGPDDFSSLLAVASR
jgi:hypothetical protein